MYLDNFENIAENGLNQNSFSSTVVVAKCIAVLSLEANIPAVIWKTKRELVEAVKCEYELYKKEQQNQEIEQKIKRLLQKK